MADKSVIDRALDEGVKDLSLVEQAMKNNDVAALHATCVRLLKEREQLARGFEAMVTGWAMLKSDMPSPANQPAIDAIERVAHEAILFAREVVQAFSHRSDKA